MRYQPHESLCCRGERMCTRAAMSPKILQNESSFPRDHRRSKRCTDGIFPIAVLIQCRNPQVLARSPPVLRQTIASTCGEIRNWSLRNTWTNTCKWARPAGVASDSIGVWISHVPTNDQRIESGCPSTQPPFSFVDMTGVIHVGDDTVRGIAGCNNNDEVVLECKIVKVLELNGSFLKIPSRQACQRCVTAQTEIEHPNIGIVACRVSHRLQDRLIIQFDVAVGARKRGDNNV